MEILVKITPQIFMMNTMTFMIENIIKDKANNLDKLDINTIKI